jgi:tryptophanyl-tRNA synthetase
MKYASARYASPVRKTTGTRLNDDNEDHSLEGRQGRALVTDTAKTIVFSGVQPTGDLHIGNLIGAISLWVRNQARHDNVFCIVDLHALTIPEAIVASELRAKILDVAALYIACGIDPARSLIFVQSHVKQHAELAWILNCVTPMGWLNRMTQFKTKAKDAETVGAGLYDYPVLQAADILLYDTHLVPVGEDQRQHIEITQDIAERFAHLFGYRFRRPEILSQKVGARIMGLDDPDVKMSKSARGSLHAINILDSEKDIVRKIRSAKTDSNPRVDLSAMSPGVQNLITIYHAFGEEPYEDTLKAFDGVSYGQLKNAVAERVVQSLRPIQQRFAEVRGDEAALRALLKRSGDAAAERAESTMRGVREAVGIS